MPAVQRRPLFSKRVGALNAIFISGSCSRAQIPDFAQTALTNVLQDRSWAVHNEIEFDDSDPTLESEPDQLQARLASSTDEKRALILNTSHIGGHKLAGNVVVYSRTGRGIWYGRVKPEHVST